jgi:hypothetical protein
VTDDVVLGEITVPSGELVLMDGGYLGLWSGARAPEEVREDDTPPGFDFEVVGPDAATAARSFNRQSGRTLYDIPQNGATQFIALFDEHCRPLGYQAHLRPFDQQIPHRERARRAIAEGDPDFLLHGVPVVAIGGLPTDRPLRVVAQATEDEEWAEIRIVVSAEPIAGTRELGDIGVDWARFVFADADALNAWEHEEPIDGLADTVFWGRDEEEIATEFGAQRTGTAGDENFGWLNLPIAEAYAKAVALDARRSAEPERRFAYDFRPHSHHWEVMAKVRASENEAGTIVVGGARILFAMTSIGDGFFPVRVDYDAAGAPVSIHVTIQEPSTQ